jgi:long-chain fatty acid transport protein
MFARTAFAALLLLAISVPARAQGFVLPAVGPVNNSIGGAGVALPTESQAALNANPALIAESQGNQVTFSTEFFKDGAHFDAKLGSMSGGTDGTIAMAVIPSFGWMGKVKSSSKVTLGFGMLGVAGFRTDFPEDSKNPLLLPQPNGYGRFYTDLQIAKIPLALAAQVTPKLSVGMSLNVYRGLLAVSPLPGSVPDTSATGSYFASAANQVPSFGFGAQVGLLYKASEMVQIGASYTTPQKFQQYKWNAIVADNSSASYGLSRPLTFTLNGPQIATFGVGLHPSKTVRLGIDGRYVDMGHVDGIGENANSLIKWRSVWAVLTGAEVMVNPKTAVRVGFSYLQTPIRAERVAFSLGTPSTFQKHFTAGFGTMLTEHLGADFGVYIVPRESITGPVLAPTTGVPVPGSQVTLSSKLTSAQIALNFKF